MISFSQALVTVSKVSFLFVAYILISFSRIRALFIISRYFHLLLFPGLGIAKNRGQLKVSSGLRNMYWLVSL